MSPSAQSRPRFVRTPQTDKPRRERQVRAQPLIRLDSSGQASCCSPPRSSERAGPVGVAADLDDLRVLDGKDLEEVFRRRRPRPVGLAAHGETEYDGVAIELHAFDSGLDAVRQQAPVPIEDLCAVTADAGPVDVGCRSDPSSSRPDSR